MGKGGRGKKAWRGKRRKAKKNRDKIGQPRQILGILETSRRLPKSGTEDFLLLDKVPRLPVAAKRYLRDHAFYRARFNSEHRAFEANNESGTLIIRGGLSPEEWQRV
jgi:hypothetical protein